MAKCSRKKLRILGAENTQKDRKKRKALGIDKKEQITNITEYVKNLFKPKRKIDDNTIRSIKNLFRVTKENEAIKGRIISE